jgi:DNA-binding transcriptional LysR family regulator
MLDITQLRYIVEVEKAGSISKAAANLYVSQPYISKLIRDVENSYGVVLFTRGKSGMVATPQGEEFIFYAKSVLNQYDQMLLSVSPMSDFANTLRVSVMRSSHTFEAFLDFIDKEKHSGDMGRDKQLKLEYLEGSLMQVIDDVANKNADVGLLGCTKPNFAALRSLAERRNITLRPVSFQRPYVVVSENHPLAKKGGPVRIPELYSYGTIVYGDRDNGAIPGNLNARPPLIDQDKVPMVIKVYDRGTQMGLMTFTDCFIIGICSFRKQEEIYRVVSLPIEFEDGVKEDDYCCVFALATLDSRRLSNSAKEFIKCAEDYFAGFSDADPL